MNNLRWIGHASTLFDMQRNLRNDMDTCEITLVAKGYSVRAHRFVLSSCSELLRGLLDSVPIGQEASIYVPDIKGALLDSVISFIYMGETSLSSINLTEFLEAVNLLGIKSAISFECNTTAYMGPSNQQFTNQQQQQQQQQQNTNSTHCNTTTTTTTNTSNVQQTNLPENAAIKNIGDIQIIHEELIDVHAKIENHQELNEDDTVDNARQLEFLNAYSGVNGAGTNTLRTTTSAGNEKSQQQQQQHHQPEHNVTFSIEQMGTPTNTSNAYIITENSGTYTLTHQNTKLETVSSATSSTCDKMDDDVDDVILEDTIDPESLAADAVIIEEFDDVNDPLLEMANVTSQQSHVHQHTANIVLNRRTNHHINDSNINVPNNVSVDINNSSHNNHHINNNNNNNNNSSSSTYAHNKEEKVTMQVKWKNRMPMQQQHMQQQQSSHQQNIHHQQQQQHHHQQDHNLDFNSMVEEDGVEDDNDIEEEDAPEEEKISSTYHHDYKDYDIDDVDVGDVDHLSYKLESHDNKSLLIIDPISLKVESGTGSKHDHAISLAVQDVINEGTSLQKAAHKFNISKTVLWRRVRKHPRYMKTARENPVLKLAYDRLRDGDSLKNISKDLEIPMSTLHRHKVRLSQEGRLPKYTAFKKRGSISKDELKEKLSKAVYACLHDGMSQNKSANLFDIPKSTLWRHLQKRFAEVEPDVQIKEEIILS